VKKRFVEEGLNKGLERRLLDSSQKDIWFDGAFEARVIALGCSEANEGRCRGTVRLLAEKVDELNIADSVSPMTIQGILKKIFNLVKKNTGKKHRRGIPVSLLSWRRP
jgi:hypothetical protein